MGLHSQISGKQVFWGVVCLHFAVVRCFPLSSSLCIGKKHLSSVVGQEFRVPFDSDRDCKEAWERERETVQEKITVLQCVLANKQNMEISFYSANHKMQSTTFEEKSMETLNLLIVVVPKVLFNWQLDLGFFFIP